MEATRYGSCLTCGEVIPLPTSTRHVGGQSPEARCNPCRNARNTITRNRTRAASYGTTSWRTLSRAMRREACCSTCGTRSDLTGEHLPGAWERVEAGLPLRPGIDVTVLCRHHNSKAGPARGPYARRA